MLRVMIVEDDPSTGALLVRLVRRALEHVSVFLEPDPWGALERWHATGADLVLLDWCLPGMSGIDILKVIRRSPKRTPCVMISAHAERDLIAAARANEIDAFILKPFDPRQAIARLAEVVANQPASGVRSEAGGTLEDFVASRLEHDTLGLPIDADLVRAIEGIREQSDEERVKTLRRCQAEPALLLRLLGMANSGHFNREGELVETLEGAVRRVGMDGFIKLANELSWYPGSDLQLQLLKDMRVELQRDCMSLLGIVTKLGQHLKFEVNACRTACLLYRVGELAVLQLMQIWQAQGHEVTAVECDQTLARYGADAADRLKVQWGIPGTVRERIAAIDDLAPGTVRRDPVVMRIAGLLHEGDHDAELSRLMARIGLDGAKLGGGLGGPASRA